MPRTRVLLRPVGKMPTNNTGGKTQKKKENTKAQNQEHNKARPSAQKRTLHEMPRRRGQRHNYASFARVKNIARSLTPNGQQFEG